MTPEQVRRLPECPSPALARELRDYDGRDVESGAAPIPTWVKAAVDAWTTAAAITGGPVIRAFNKAGRLWGVSQVLWDAIRTAAARGGIDTLAPQDLRRTCARLYHLAGGELDQIQCLLGHVSV